eukprot:202866_1
MEQNQIVNNTSNSQIKRPIQLWRELRAVLNTDRVNHCPVNIFKHKTDYDHFCIIYFQLHPLLKKLYYIPNGISKYIAEYATGFFDECDNCKTYVHIFFEECIDKPVTFWVTSKCINDKYSFIKISCLCTACAQHRLLVHAVHDDIPEIWFKVKKCTKMKKLMVAYANRNGVLADTLSFEFQMEFGHEKKKVFIMNDMTPYDLGMKDEDPINVSNNGLIDTNI